MSAALRPKGKNSRADFMLDRVNFGLERIEFGPALTDLGFES